MNIKETFLKLTEYTTPFGKEGELENILLSLVPDLKKDSIGNYHKVIGNTETLFACHLDNFCRREERVNHIIENNIIRTDETTILGANKAGVCVLLYLINNNVPGHYCLFVGEEPITTDGCYGSYMFGKSFKSIFKYKRAIAFDGKENSSLVTRQMAQSCCSNKFVNELIKRFSKNSIILNADPKSYYSDTSSFLESISECTNISVGIWNENSNKEYVDIDFVEKIAIASSKIDWESLPNIRIPKCFLLEEKEVDSEYISDYEYRLWEVVSSELTNLNFLCMNKLPYCSNRTMIFNNWFEDFELEITIKNNIVEINGYEVKVDIDFDSAIFEPNLSQIISTIKEDNLAEMAEGEEIY